jgi:hypothetical protein
VTWIRWDVRTPTHEVVGALAEPLRIPTSHALGYYVAVCCGFGEYQPDGNADAVTDATLEDWALWRGTRGRFAKLFRELCVERRDDQKDTAGTVKGWWRQRALLEKQARDNRRPGPAGRESHHEPAENPPETRADFPGVLGAKMDGYDDEDGNGNGTTPSPTGRAGTKLVGRLSGHPHRWAVIEWLAALPDGQDHEHWAAVLNGCLDGLGMPSNVPATPADIAAMCVDWKVLQANAKGDPYNPAYVKGCIAHAQRARNKPDRRKGGGPFVGADRRTENTLENAKSWASESPEEPAA